jgi:hypothetical protein
MLRIPIPFTKWTNEYNITGRRVICIGWPYVGLYYDIKYENNPEWILHHGGGRAIIFHWRLEWGEDHFYYDCPHCFYNFGPISIEWSKDVCKKCHPGW